MRKRVSTGLLAASLIALTCLPWGIVADAQTPYWDNSSDNNQPYYNPGPSNNNNNNANPSSGQSGYGQSNYGQNAYGQPQNYNQQQPALRGYVSTAPAGTTLSGATSTYISSSSCQIGDPVSVALGNDLSMGGNVILPAGSMVQGQVVSCVPAGRTGRHGQLQLRFNRASLPDGRIIPLSARVITQDGTGIIRGGTSGQRVGSVAKNTLGGAALGAASGAALGAIVSGGRKWNEGLMWGSIFGAGGGLARSGLQRGEEAEVQPGSPLQLMLDQPLTVNPNEGQGYNNNNNNNNNNYNNGGYPY